MIQVVMMVFVIVGGNSFQLVADKEFPTLEECVNKAIKINADNTQFNAACFVKQVDSDT